MLEVNKFSTIPIYEQLLQNLKIAIYNGEFVGTTPLPSVRSLSLELLINPNTVQKAYNELEHLGLCYSVSGSGRYVSDDALEIIKNESIKQLDNLKSEIDKLLLTGIAVSDIIQFINESYPKN